MVNWISLSTTTGNSGETQITLTVSPNTEYSSRTTTLNVTTQSKYLTDNIVINQAQKSATGSMTFNPSGLSYSYEGGVSCVEITANDDWNIIDYPTWLSYSGVTSGSAGTYILCFTAPLNSSQNINSGNITFSCGGNTFIVSTYQEAYQQESGYTNMPLTFEFIESGVLYYTVFDSNHIAITLEYSINNSEWSSRTIAARTTATESFSLQTGDIIRFRSNDVDTGVSTFHSTTRSNVYGNIMSLKDKSSFSSLIDAANFKKLFYNYTGLISAANLILPSRTVNKWYYQSMFEGCTALISPPQIMATTLQQEACRGMFRGCTSLTTAPELPATTLGLDCYWNMFAGCTSLTTAPELPATTLAQGCYREMFSGCTSLTTAPELPATTLASSCYAYMFADCTSLTTAPELPATTLAYNCYDNMFSYCTSLTTAPSSIGTSTTVMAASACTYMFNGCSSLTTAPELPVTTLKERCYGAMFYNCTNLTTAPELPATTLTNSCYTYMFYGCSNLQYIKCLATNISASNCLKNWVQGVQTSSGTFIKSSSMSSWTTGSSGIPSGWTVQDA